MLTPEKIKAMNAVSGLNVPLDPTAPPSRAQQVMDIAKKAQAMRQAAADAAKPKLGQGGAGEFAGNAVRTAYEDLAGTGAFVEKGIDQTLGRVGNAIAGNGFVPTHTGQDVQNAEQASQQQHADSFSGKVGDLVGHAASFLTPAGEEKTVGQGAAKVIGGIAKEAKGALVGTAEDQAAKQAAKITDILAPKQTAKEAAESLATRGGTKQGILGTIKTNTDPAVKRIADTVEKYVPDFSPKKTLVENINATKDAVGKLATDLKQKVVESGQDRIYSFKELGAKLKGIEKSPQLVGDVEKTYDKVVDKAMEIARNNGGKVSDLFQSRKEFDDYIAKAFPDLYSSERLTPMRSAIKDIRNAMTDFTAEHLPEDVGLRDSLTAQHHLMTAIENMAEKAASGVDKEVGTNALERAASAIKRHPVASGLGGALLYEEAKKVPGIGAILP